MSKFKKIKDAAKGLVSAVVDTAEDTLKDAKSSVADGLNEFVSDNKTNKDPQGKGKKMNTEKIEAIVVADKPKVTEDNVKITVLAKGETVALPAMNTVAVGIEWDEATSGPEIDMDVSCLLVRPGKTNELVYFGMPQVNGKLITKCGNVLHTGDNLTGADDAEDQDDETIFAQLNNLDADVTSISFFANIYQAVEKKQNFGTSGHMSVRAYDLDTGVVFMKANLGVENSTDISMVVGEFRRTTDGWEYVSQAAGGNLSMQQWVDSNHG